MRVILEIKRGMRADIGKKFEVSSFESDNLTVGRSAFKSERFGERYPHIQISSKDFRLSRWHFLLQLRPPNLYICDLGSTNGTYVNNFDTAIDASVELNDGDIIKAGGTFLRVSLIQEERPQVFSCVRCGKELREIELRSPEDLGAEDFICGECRKKEERIIEAKEVIKCSNCGKDLTEQANRDGKANILKDVAIYLCRNCAFSERKEEKEIGDYVVLYQIGLGGMGIVYKAWHKKTERIVALKELIPEKLMDDRSLKIFHREIAITQLLVHPNIVRFYESFSKRRRPYLVTEYLAGGNVGEKIIHMRKPFDVGEACRIILQVLEGLSYAHSKAIVHRDIKPQNFLIGRDGHVKLSDMGLAKNFELAGQSGITKSGMTGGTPLYMAPEQFLEFRFVKPPADVYSIGVCLYYFLTGKFPYHFPTELDLILHAFGLKPVKSPFQIILEDDPIPILERRNDIPESLAAVIDKCLRKDPKARFKDASELKEAIKKAVRA